jgi:ATP-binding cassette subfamily B protein
MKFEKGKCVGVMGSNGIGKSTLIQLLCGLYEADSGSISMFGHNINAWKLDKLRQHISYMCQEIVILPDTIYENIRYGNMKATEEEIYNAARMAGLEDFIKGLEAGYNTVLQEDGANLSGGQKQRISMARTFLKNSDLYIFDEPTASLEPELEKKIMNEIMKFIRVKNAASLIVSHNVNNLSECDTIYYMQNGKVIESGSMNELLLKKGKFYQKYNEMIGVNSL